MQQRCPNCGSPIVPGQRFCGGCGAQLSLACPQCRITVSPGTRFCPNCGATLGGGMPQQPGWGQQQPGGMPPQQPGRMQQPGVPQQPGWGQQQGVPQQPGWGQQQGMPQQQAWSSPARQSQPASSNRPLLLGLLIFLLIGLGTLTYLYTPIGDTVKDLVQSVTGGTGGTTTVQTGPLEITEVKVQNLTAIRADIRWNTNKTASTQAEYGTSSNYGNTTELTDVPVPGEFLGVAEHVVHLTGLEPNTKYYYKVKSKDATGTEVVEEGNFNTPQMPEE